MTPKVDYLLVKDEPGLVRDTYSNAILPYDLSQKQKFLKEQKRELAIKNAAELNTRVEKMEASIENIQTTMTSLVKLIENMQNRS
jgi:hypothetical protein